MNWLSRTLRRLRALTRSADTARDMAEELRLHIEMETDDLVRRGIPREEARRRALVAFGGVDRFSEEGRDVRGAPWLEGFARDVRFGVRSLRRTPGVTALATVMLALGIGLTTMAFSILYAGFIRGLPYPDPGQLVIVRRMFDQSGQYLGSSGPDLVALRAAQRSFAGLAASHQITANVSSSGTTVRYRGSAITPNTFSLLGVRPILGRDFDSGDEKPGAQPVVLLGHATWVNHFGGDTAAVGRAIRVNGRPHVVIGVMPAGLRFPQADELWVAMRMDRLEIEMDPAQLRYRGQQFLRTWGRLLPGVSMASARKDADAITRRLQQEYGGSDSTIGAIVLPLEESYVKVHEKRMVTAMVAAVFSVLLIACANVANLLLTRAIHRTREVGIRNALGASRAAITRQFLTESCLVATAGAAIGVTAAAFGIEAFNRSPLHGWLPFYSHVGFYWPVLLFAVGLALAATLVSGALPALQARKVDVNTVLKDESRGASGFRVGRASQALVTFEIALSALLAVAAGLLIKSVVRAGNMDLGFRTDGIFVASITFPPSDTATARQQAFYDDLQRRLAAIPGVQTVALSTPLPGVYQTGDYIALEGVVYQTEDDHRWVYTQVATPSLFATFDMRLLRGRGFTEQDRSGAEPVAVVTEGMANRFFPDQNAIGRRIRLGGLETRSPWRTIVGIVPDAYSGTTSDPHQARVYLPLAQEHAREVSIALRTAGDPLALTPLVRAAVAELDQDLPVAPIRGGAHSMDQLIFNQTSVIRVFAGLFGALGAIALGLAFAGLFGVMAFAVNRRRREVGIRIALGANARQVARTVLGQGAVHLALGLTVGLAASLGMGQGLRSLLFDVRPLDLGVFAAASGVLVLAGLAACWVPMRRAVRVNPVETLRSE